MTQARSSDSTSSSSRRSRLDPHYHKYQSLAALDPLRYMGSAFVPGDGPVPASIMFIGEAPGRNEDEQRKPFVGRSGQLLEEGLKAAGLDRSEVFITNVLKYRPPKNRDPSSMEIDASIDCLRAEVKIVRPVVVVLLGRYAYNVVFPGKSVTADHGEAKLHRGRCWIPIYHPSFALRTKIAREHFIADMMTVPRWYRSRKFKEA